MLRILVNKVPSVRFGPWWGLVTKLNSGKLLTEIPEDLDIAEKYLYDFTQFYSPGDRYYCRINMLYKAPDSYAEIQSVISSFKQKMKQSLQVAHLDALSPVAMVTLTRSVKCFATLLDFSEVFK